jgi:hypothetical protein
MIAVPRSLDDCPLVHVDPAVARPIWSRSKGIALDRR